MFAYARFVRSWPRSIESAAPRIGRIAWARPRRETQPVPDDAPKLEELFVTSAFLDFGGVPTELLRWHELRQRGR